MKERQCACGRNIEMWWSNHGCRRKAGSVTHSQCVPVALVIQHANRILSVQ
jgi:hypothetical protein